MNPWLAFIIGLIVGATVGLFIMAFLVAARDADERGGMR